VCLSYSNFFAELLRCAFGNITKQEELWLMTDPSTVVLSLHSSQKGNIFKAVSLGKMFLFIIAFEVSKCSFFAGCEVLLTCFRLEERLVLNITGTSFRTHNAC